MHKMFLLHHMQLLRYSTLYTTLDFSLKTAKSMQVS